MKKALIIIGIIVLLLGGGYFALSQVAGNPDDIIIKDIDVKDIADGVYTGEYETALVSAEVEVTIAGGKIAKIEILRHDCGKGKKAEIITDHVIDDQSLMVDTISGATISSKIILKAVENALSKGK